MISLEHYTRSLPAFNTLLLLALAALWVGMQLMEKQPQTAVSQPTTQQTAVSQQAISTSAVVSGYLSRYDKQPTDRVLANRQAWGQVPSDLSRFDGYLAVLDCDRIGQTAAMEAARQSFTMLVFDCAEAGAADGSVWMIEGNYAAEMDWYFYQQHPDLLGQWIELRFYE